MADRQRVLRLACGGALADHVYSVLENYTRKAGHRVHALVITRLRSSHRSVEDHLLFVAVLPCSADEPAAEFVPAVGFVRRCADPQVSSSILSMVAGLVAAVICSSICQVVSQLLRRLL